MYVWKHLNDSYLNFIPSILVPCSSDSNSEQIILENLPPVNVVIAIRNNVFFLLLPKKIHIFHSKFKKKRIKKQDFDRIIFCLSVNLPVGRNEYV